MSKQTSATGDEIDAIMHDLRVLLDKHPNIEARLFALLDCVAVHIAALESMAPGEAQEMLDWAVATLTDLVADRSDSGGRKMRGEAIN